MVNIQTNAPLVYVSFSAEINASTTERLIAIMSECANLRVQKVVLLISSGGGLVMNGLNLYNVLKGMPFDLVTHNVGNIDSISNAVFLAGSTRYSCCHSTFMFHGVGFDIVNQRLEQKNIEEFNDSIVSDQKRIGDIITECSTLGPGDVINLFRQAQTKSAEYALGCGIIHEIREVEIISGVPIIPLVFQR